MDNLKALLAKVWKNEELNLAPGSHYVDEVRTVHISGTVQKQNDSMVAPTTSLPLIPIIALILEKSGITRDHSLKMLTEAITESVVNGKTKSDRIEARMKDIESAVNSVRKDLIAKLPKQRRAGRVITKDLQVEVLPVEDEAFTTAVA